MITVDDVAGRMKDIAARHGQRRFTDVHRMCVYAAGGRPVCLIGLLLASYGVPLRELESFGQRSLIRVDSPYLRRFTEEARALMNLAQIHNDEGQTFGEAVSAAFTEFFPAGDAEGLDG